jgi:hypothetical protein
MAGHSTNRCLGTLPIAPHGPGLDVGLGLAAVRCSSEEQYSLLSRIPQGQCISKALVRYSSFLILHPSRLSAHLLLRCCWVDGDGVAIHFVRGRIVIAACRTGYCPVFTEDGGDFQTAQRIHDGTLEIVGGMQELLRLL